jgi:hypothetical protein
LSGRASTRTRGRSPSRRIARLQLEQTVLIDLEQFVARETFQTFISALPLWLSGSKPARCMTRSTLRRRWGMNRIER